MALICSFDSVATASVMAIASAFGLMAGTGFTEVLQWHAKTEVNSTTNIDLLIFYLRCLKVVKRCDPLGTVHSGPQDSVYPFWSDDVVNGVAAETSVKLKT